MQYAPVYHVTPVYVAGRIIKANALRVGTFPHPTLKELGVSFTRSFAFADEYIPHNKIIFEFDQQRIRFNHALIPTNYWYKKSQMGYYPHKDEMEEFLVGPLCKIDKYLTKIIATEDLLGKWWQFDFGMMVVEHPKLFINGKFVNNID